MKKLLLTGAMALGMTAGLAGVAMADCTGMTAKTCVTAGLIDEGVDPMAPVANVVVGGTTVSIVDTVVASGSIDDTVKDVVVVADLSKETLAPVTSSSNVRSDTFPFIVKIEDGGSGVNGIASLTDFGTAIASPTAGTAAG